MRGIEAKVVVLGSRGVGKTHLVTKYINNNSQSDVSTTMVAALFTCKIKLDDVKIKLHIWDTAGQERYRAVAPMYYRNANAAILVFDLSRHKSFTELKSWIKELHRNVQDPLVLTLVGNKMDLHSQREVPHEEANVYSLSIGARYFETCAGMDQGLGQVFEYIALGLVRLANEGKCRSLRQFDSCDSISAYTNGDTAFSHSRAAMSNGGSSGNGAFHLPAVPMGIPVESDDVKINGMGRLEIPFQSIDNIAWGEEIRSGLCCF